MVRGFIGVLISLRESPSFSTRIIDPIVSCKNVVGYDLANIEMARLPLALNPEVGSLTLMPCNARINKLTIICAILTIMDI
jgi:hypothetical protein